MQGGFKVGVLFRPLVLLALCATGQAYAQATEKSRCFDIGGLSPALQERSEHMLLGALDSEHLFTLATGLKPMSAGFFNAQVAVSAPEMDLEEAHTLIEAHAGTSVAALADADRIRLETARAVQARYAALDDIEDVRRILATWTCGGQIQADLVHYANVRGGQRHLHAVVFALPSLRQLLLSKSTFFSRWAFTPGTSPLEIVTAVEYARDATRFAGYGYLFGYPDQAVEFFAMASTSQEVTGRFVVRDFRAIPTFQRETGQFTYAVPRGAEESEADRELRARAARILAAYKVRRPHYIGEGKPGAAALLRDWFCPDEHHCSPADAVL